MTDTRTERIAKVDRAIAWHHEAELRCVWANHGDEVEFHVYEIARLENVRNLIERRQR